MAKAPFGLRGPHSLIRAKIQKGDWCRLRTKAGSNDPAKYCENATRTCDIVPSAISLGSAVETDQLLQLPSAVTFLTESLMMVVTQKEASDGVLWVKLG